MKKLFILLACLLAFSAGCKTRKTTDGTTNNPGQTTGVVSHQYQSTGCSTVILVSNADSDTPQVLIPKDKLDKKFDQEGLTIKFNYRLLKMPNPPGCSVGNIAEITDISK